jgi:hypothetical protein
MMPVIEPDLHGRALLSTSADGPVNPGQESLRSALPRRGFGAMMATTCGHFEQGGNDVLAVCF